MGIKGLLPVLNGAERNITVEDLRNQTVGIDAYVWLHKGSYSCILDIFQNKRTTKYINYCVNQIKFLQFFNIKPYLVFDGGLLPKKGGTEKNRNDLRNENREKGFEYLKLGQKSKANDCFRKSVDVTPYMAYQLIKELRKMKIDFVVAPYEADAQLAYLEKIGVIQAIITEDSDLLVFGCKRVIYKWTKEGTGSEICRDRFKMCRGIDLNGWNDEMFRHMCILSGCDYLPNIPKIGIKKAYNLVKQKRYIKNILFEIKQRYDLKVPPDYEQQFIEADKTFLYQRVFDPIKNELVTLNPIPDELNIEDMEYIGPLLEKEIAEGVAKGDLNPLTKEPNSNELVDPHYKELLNQFNSEESSNNKDIKNEPLKANKLFRPSQFKVTMNYNKSDFLTNALNNGNQKKNNSSLIRLFQKSNENNNNNLPEKPKSYHIQEVVKNNITEISIIDNVDDIANSSDIEININNNYSNEISNINLNESIVIDEILNSSDNENDNSNINQNENIKSNCLNDTSLHNNNNNNNRDNNMDTNDNNDDNNINKNNKKNSSIINNNIDGNISDDNIKNDTPKQKVCSQNINSKSVKPIKNDNSNVKVKIIENFFSKNNSFSKHRSTTKNTTMDTGNPLSNKEKSKENNIKTTSNKNNKNKSKSQSIPNNSISNYFLSNKQKSCSTTPKLNRHTSYPVVKCNNRQELITNYQKKNLKSLFDSLNNNADVVEKQKNIIELKKVFDSSNNNADVVEKQKNIVNNNESSMKNNLTSIMEEKKTLDNGIIIDDIQDSDTEENNPLNIQRVNNSLMQSIVPESSFSNNSIADKTIENIINQNNERASSNLNQNIKNDTKSKLKSLFNRNNILLKKSASVSDISPYFSRKFSDQEVDNIESMNNENNKMIVDEPEPVYISDSENESNNKSNENNEESNVQVCIGQKNNINNDNNNNSSNNKNSNIENESEDKKSNSSNNSNQIHSHSISYLYDDDKGGSFSSNSSFLNIFDTFSKSDNEDDILPEVFEVYPKKADSENKIANTQSSTTQNHSSNNDDTNSDDSNHTNNCCTSTINISQMLNSFNTNSLKRKREDLTNINANSQNRNVMKKESFSEENKQNTSHSEKVNNNQSNKNINLILREKFAYNKNIEIKNKSANQILTQSLMSSLPSYNLNSSVKASKAYVAPKINKKKNIKRKTLSSSSQNKKEKENQKIEENRLETSALRNFLYEKFKYKE